VCVCVCVCVFVLCCVVCVSAMYAKEDGGSARSRVRAGANEIGEIRSARRSADGSCRPSLSNSWRPAYRVVVVSLSTASPRAALHRTTARRATTTISGLSAAGKTIGGREDNAEVSWRSSGAIFRTSGLILWPGNRIDRRSLGEYPARLSRFSNLWGNCGRTYASWTPPYGICSSP